MVIMGTAMDTHTVADMAVDILPVQHKHQLKLLR